MPPRWPREPDRRDPAYRRLDDRMNFAVHVAGFLAVNSGLWFAEQVKYPEWSWLFWFTILWGGVLLLHLIYISVIADYSVKSNG